MAMIVLKILILFGAVLFGIFMSCKVFAYEISSQRKLLAAVLFVTLVIVPVPIPVLSFIVPFIALYIALMDDKLEREEVRKVFGLTLLFAVLGVLLISFLD